MDLKTILEMFSVLYFICKILHLLYHLKITRIKCIISEYAVAELVVELSSILPMILAFFHLS